jgi:hypothetical protein
VPIPLKQEAYPGTPPLQINSSIGSQLTPVATGDTHYGISGAQPGNHLNLSFGGLGEEPDAKPIRPDCVLELA